MMSSDDGSGCRAVGNARKGKSSVRLVTFAIIAAHISRRTKF